MGKESMHPAIMDVPGAFLAYNLFISGIESFGQLSSSHATERKDQLVLMTVFTFLPDKIVINAYALYNSIPFPYKENIISHRKFKRLIAMALVDSLLQQKKQQMMIQKTPISPHCWTMHQRKNCFRHRYSDTHIVELRTKKACQVLPLQIFRWTCSQTRPIFLRSMFSLRSCRLIHSFSW